MQVDKYTNPVMISSVALDSWGGGASWGVDSVLLGGRIVRCHHGSQGASSAVPSYAVGLTLGPLVFLPLQAPGLNSSPTPVNPTLWQLMVTIRPDWLCPGWTQSWTEFSQAVYFLSHGDLLGSPASF